MGFDLKLSVDLLIVPTIEYNFPIEPNLANRICDRQKDQQIYFF